MSMVMEIAQAAQQAKAAMNKLSTIEKNRILEAMAQGLLNHTEFILKQNMLDVEAAKEKAGLPR